ncbi:YozQ family protein [Ornithinibacillus salinisoli]|uniref:YozQ family protein n=1 Tax=Ornithinibacillus salinisoli TaxID=1848459 RepID=A0ABW4W1V3_9BACI
MVKKENQNTVESAKEVADKTYEASDYKSQKTVDQGMAVTHEQATDAYTEGTVDGKIDAVDKQTNLKSHNGEDIPRKGFK